MFKGVVESWGGGGEIYYCLVGRSVWVEMIPYDEREKDGTYEMAYWSFKPLFDFTLICFLEIEE